MKLLREILGYVLGGVLFVGLMPAVMWLATGMPALEHIGALRASITGVEAVDYSKVKDISALDVIVPFV